MKLGKTTKKTVKKVEKKLTAKEQYEKEMESFEEPEAVLNEEKVNKKKDLVILKTFTQPDPHHMLGVQMICTQCGKKDYYAYEIVSVQGSDKKMEPVCYECISKAGYVRVLRKSGWDWNKIKGKLGREEYENIRKL
jgi:hypothetical protein